MEKIIEALRNVKISLRVYDPWFKLFAEEINNVEKTSLSY
jgi:hypothetical protein